MKEKSLVRSWIRDTTRNGVRYYSVVDAIAGTVDTKNPRDYWYHIKNRPMDEHDFMLSTLCRQLRLKAKDGKCRRRRGHAARPRTAPCREKRVRKARHYAPSLLLRR